MSKLAINGGNPVRTTLFPAYNPIGEEEKQAAIKVIESGNLSQYLGTWHKDFYGGPCVRAFEDAWREMFQCKHAWAVNSNTSGLYAAIGACGIGPGDEVIVSPYTMSASAIAAAVYGAVPVFADIDPINFGLCPKSIEANITPRTKAILVVHIFGHPADMDAIMAIAGKHRLRVIEDCAQAPMSTCNGRPVGTIGDVGVFSLNYHKHIHTGEGGVMTTNDDELSEKLTLIRNHAEAVVGPMGRPDLGSLIGYNYRMTEIQAAIGIEQLKKLPRLVDERIENADYLTRQMQGLEGLTQVIVQDNCKHVYYVQPIYYHQDKLGVHRDRFVDAVNAELPSSHLREEVPLLSGGYVSPLYWQPFYQKRMTACSFNCPKYQGEVRYDRGLCPVTERMHLNELITHEFMRPGMSRKDLDDVVMGFAKVCRHIKNLAE